MTTETSATTETNTITVSHLDGGARGTSLHHRYAGQSEPQDCFVALNCESGRLYASHNTEIGNAVPFAVHHGHVQRWSIPALRDGAANDLLDELAPIAERIVAGYVSRWDGHNHVAKFTADATEAIDEIRAACEAVEARDDSDDAVSVWDAGSWFGGVGSYDQQRAALGITATTTDEELDAIMEREEATASAEGVDILDGATKHLRGLRDEARAEYNENEDAPISDDVRAAVQRRYTEKGSAEAATDERDGNALARDEELDESALWQALDLDDADSTEARALYELHPCESRAALLRCARDAAARGYLARARA
jgi:hypothetical protein